MLTRKQRKALSNLHSSTLLPPQQHKSFVFRCTAKSHAGQTPLPKHQCPPPPGLLPPLGRRLAPLPTLSHPVPRPGFADLARECPSFSHCYRRPFCHGLSRLERGAISGHEDQSSPAGSAPEKARPTVCLGLHRRSASVLPCVAGGVAPRPPTGLALWTHPRASLSPQIQSECSCKRKGRRGQGSSYD